MIVMQNHTDHAEPLGPLDDSLDPSRGDIERLKQLGSRRDVADHTGCLKRMRNNRAIIAEEYAAQLLLFGVAWSATRSRAHGKSSRRIQEDDETGWRRFFRHPVWP